MFDPTGKLLLPDAELEAEARAVAGVTFPAYRDDAKWDQAWSRYLLMAADSNWHPDDVKETRLGLAVRQARAAIETWKRNATYGLDAVPFDDVFGPP